MRRINADTMALLKRLEGLELLAYRDIAGVLTIGYGSTGRHVQEGMRITEPQAEALLLQDLERFEDAVDSLVKVPLSDEQFGALVSLAFNIGIRAFRDSTLLRKLNAGDYTGAQQQFAVWNKAGGKVVKGLVNRRAAEAALFGRGQFASSNTVEPDPPKPIAKSKTIQGAAATGGAGLLAIAPEVVEVARESAWDADGILKIILTLVIVIGTAVAIYSRLKRRRETGV